MDLVFSILSFVFEVVSFVWFLSWRSGGCWVWCDLLWFVVGARLLPRFIKCLAIPSVGETAYEKVGVEYQSLVSFIISDFVVHHKLVVFFRFRVIAAE